jgi:hypothetical protein
MGSRPKGVIHKGRLERVVRFAILTSSEADFICSRSFKPQNFKSKNQFDPLIFKIGTDGWIATQGVFLFKELVAYAFGALGNGFGQAKLKPQVGF